jgi:hypothetical protein
MGEEVIDGLKMISTVHENGGLIASSTQYWAISA